MSLEDILGLAALIGVPILVFFVRSKSRQLRVDRLAERFGSKEVAIKILRGQVWQGMNMEMLRESWGKPDEIDRNVFKSKTKETWKYGRIGKNRYKRRVMLENEIVVGWR